MKQYDFTVVGTAATVSVLHVDEMPQAGKSTPVFDENFMQFTHGGKGFNIVAGLHKLGNRVYPVLTYCDARLRPNIHAYIEETGMPADGIKDPPEGALGTTLIIQDKHKNHMTLITGYSQRLPNCNYYGRQEMLPHFFDNSKMVVLTAPLAANTEPALRAIEASGTPLALSMCIDRNAFPPSLLWKALENAFIVFANEAEVQYITKEYGLSHISDLFQNGKTRYIVETLGGDGSRVYEWTGTDVAVTAAKAVPAQTKTVETVGAGDAYICGFLHGLIRGRSIADCARLGGSVSSFVLEMEGSVSNLPTEKQLLERFAASIEWERKEHEFDE